MTRITTPTQWRIIDTTTGRPVGKPGPAGAISDRCTELNDAANPDEDVPRVVVYKVEKYRDEHVASCQALAGVDEPQPSGRHGLMD